MTALLKLLELLLMSWLACCVWSEPAMYRRTMMPITPIRRVVLLSVLALLPACTTTATSRANCPPPSPKLTWSPAEHGGVCLSGEATALLLDYIDGLERCGG